MTARRFTETTTKRVGYGMAIVYVLMLALAVIEPFYGIAAAPIGFAGGLWLGRLVEARESAKGNGVILGE